MFPEIWDTIAPMLQSVLREGKGVRADDLLLFLERNGYPEECYFTFSYSPILDETGKVGGVFTPVQETTERVIGERRLRTLSQLAAIVTDQKSTAEQTAKAALASLNQNPYDVPFAALYLFEGAGGSAKRYAYSGPLDEGLAPESIDEQTDSLLSGLFSTQSLRTTRLVHTGAQISDSWGTPVTEYLCILSNATEGERPRGFLLIGINPRKRLDEAYGSFLDLLVDTVFGLISKAEAFEKERQRAEALIELDKAKTVFFSNASHEFRTPLTLIMSPVERSSTLY